MRSLDALFAQLAALGVRLEADGGTLKVRGPAGAVSADLKAELAARKPDLLAALTAADPTTATGIADDDLPAAPVARPDPAAPAPLTHNQRRLWFLEKLGETGASFTMSAAWEISGPLDPDALCRAVGALTRRHTILRSVITEQDGEPRLITPPWQALDIAVSTAPAGERDALVAAETATPFDLSRALFRARLVGLESAEAAGDRWLLLISLHHLISDRWSMGLLFRDLAALMTAEATGLPDGLPALPVQFADVAAWQRARQTDAALAADLVYWKDRLAGSTADLALPLDRPRPPVRATRGAAHRFTLPADADLGRLAARQGATAFMAYLAVYGLLLARWTGQDDLVVGCPLGSRDLSETHDLIGFFVNTVALRLDLTDDPAFSTLLARARTVSLEAFAHQDTPFDRVVDALKPQRHLNRNPLFQAMFVMQTAEVSPLAWPGVTVTPLEPPAMAPEVDLNLALEPPAEAGAGVTGYLEYDPDLFDAATAARFGRQFAALARAVAETPDTPLSRLPLTDPEEAVASWSGPTRPAFLAPARLDALVLERLEARPDAPAVLSADGQTVPAGALAARARSVTARLAAAGVAPGTTVGVTLPRGTDLIAALLGCLHAEAPFVVLPLDAPQAHRDRVARAAGLTVALTGQATAAALPEGVTAICLEDPETDGRTVRESSRARLDPGRSGHPAGDACDARCREASPYPAYLCFTSGTTGTPKGIAVGHGALVNHAHAVADAFALTEADRVLQFAAPAFDVALEEIFPTLLAGGTVVIPPVEAVDSLDAFGTLLDRAGVTVANLPAPFWHAWVRELEDGNGSVPATLRLLVTGSDRVHTAAVAAWERRAPHAAWLSGYGPSEATITAALFDPRRDRLPAGADSVPLGQPLANVTLHVADGAGRPVPTGVIGEIVIEGAGVARGYAGDAPAEAFRPRRDGGPMAYWTGDLGRRLPDGTLAFAGRRDGQLKIRGVRVEPAAVEAVLAAHPAAGTVAVTGCGDGSGGLMLRATVTGPADADTLRQWARERLPAAMVPQVFETMAALPLTPSGKIDRRALAARPLPDLSPSPAATPPAAPADEQEALIADIFARVLERPDVGPDSNFFALGGDSIRSLQIVARARRAGLAVTARMIFEHQTVAAIARAATLLDDEPDGPPGHGPVPSTPILRWFHEAITTDPHHFNQAVVLAVPTGADPAAMTTALTALVACHDALRLRVTGRGAEATHTIPEAGADTPVPALTVLPTAGLDDAAREARRTEAFAAAQAGLDPWAGRNLAAVLLPDEGRMLLTLHHLCIDVLSWGVVLEDLEAAYEAASAGTAPRLRRRGTPYRLWAERLNALARDEEATGDLTYWLTLLGHPADRLLPEAGEAPGVDSAMGSVRARLPRAATTDLMRTAPAAFGCRSDEVILAGLLKNLRTRGGSRLRVDLERNGRVSPFDDLDLSRTVGWFTTVLPLMLDADSDDPATLLEGVRRAVADSPADGLGHGLLRHVADTEASGVLAVLPGAEILVNFVGAVSDGTETMFRPVDMDTGPTVAPGSPRCHVLELNAGVVGGQLLLELSYPGDAGCTAGAQALLDDLTAALTSLGTAARRARSGLTVPDDVVEVLPLTPLQRGILLHSLRERETYFDQLHLTLTGPLDTIALRAAWDGVAARHKALRASFHFGADGQPVQFIHDTAAPAWIEKDWRALDPAAQAADLAALMAADRAAGFVLDHAPLMRLYLIRLAEDRHALIWSAHHLLLDGWSVSLVMEEVLALYAHSPVPAPADFAAYVTWVDEADHRAARDHWAATLAGLDDPTLLAGPGLSPDAEATPEPADSPIHVALPLTPAEGAAIEGLARSSGVTVGVVLQAAWSLLLGRYTGQTDVAFGLTVSGRPADLPGIDRMVGMLINTLPMRVSLTAGTPVTAWLRDIGARTLTSSSFTTTPLPEALAAAGLSAGTLPFDSLVLIQNYPRPAGLSANGLSVTLTLVDEATSFPVTLVAEWSPVTEAAPAPGAEPHGPVLSVVRDPRRLSHAAAGRILGHLRQLLRAMTEAPDATIDRLSLYDAKDRTRRLALDSGPVLPIPADEAGTPLPAPALFDRWAGLVPDAPAVVSWDATLDYGTLKARSDRLAALLALQGIGPGKRVALAAPRSAALVTAFVAILKAGGAVVPLDVAYPEDRLRFMLDDCGAALVLTDRAGRDRLPLAEGTPVLLLEDLDEAETLPADLPVPPPAIAPTDAAYVIYTSGSTGRPKGVENAHRGLSALIAAQRALFGITPGDRLLQYASLSFDASVWEIAMALGAGAALYLPSREEALAGPELGSYLRNRRITAATLPPSLLAVVPEGSYPDFRLLVVAGEACPPALAKRWARGRRFFNAYGPSETTVCATAGEGGGDGLTLPIGGPIPNASAHVVDSRLEPVPPGCEGELLIGGPGVAPGYINRPDLTAERFINDPFAPEGTAGRLYRTGDRVRLLPDGQLVFLGRMDRQVKVRGFRIEPGEIEAALAARPGVARALVGVREDARGEPRLVAWILPAEGTPRPDPDALRRSVKDELPDHMVPAAVLLIDSVPLTPNGKVNWAALPATARDAGATPDASPPSPAPGPGDGSDTTVRRKLATLWQDLLDRPAVGEDDNFFDIGGHSLLLVQMQGLVTETFGVSLAVSELFAHPTIRSLARRLVDAGVAVEEAAAPPAETAPPTETAPEEKAPRIETAAPSALNEPIAVIGMAGRFPGAADVEAFWDMLVAEQEGIRRFSPEECRAAGVPGDILADPNYVAAGGILDDAEAFDPAVFGLGPRDALVLDPQHRVFLECAWHALEDAGYAPGRADAPIGLFGGSGYNTWLREVLVPAGESLHGSGGFHLVTGNDKDFLTTQAAYRLNLKGPAVTIQTACSTSLVAIVQAVEALQAGRCAMALAGGVAITFPQTLGYLYEPDMILSPDGHCRAFATDAAGTVPGSGAGVVLLKPLSRALADGDRVLSVIRGAALNNDGADKMGFTAPGVEGQAGAIRMALAAAGLTPGDVDYVETHGTGTALGDPVEVTALARVYGGRAEPLLLGSVKSNIGHADTAAGVAGFIKATLALSRGQLPASLHATALNPRIDWAAGPFAVVDRTRPLPERDRPVRAGVSAFGIGGTNAHVILEAPPVAETAPQDNPETVAEDSHILVLSAQSAAALERQAARLADHLSRHPDLPVADVAATLQTGRAALRHRRAVVASSLEDAAMLLEIPDGGLSGIASPQPPAVALLFPGQGSQHPRMGAALYHAGGIFRQEMDSLSAALEPHLRLSLTDLLYGSDGADGEMLRRTEIAQPAVFAVSLALARHWQSLGLPVEGMLGHSVGEYAAACLAGVFSQEDALALIVDRGRLVAEMPAGAMLGVADGEAAVQTLLDDPCLPPGLSLAAINGPRLCVVSGPEEAIAALETRLDTEGRPGRRLATSHAFHNLMLAPAALALADAVAARAPRPPRRRFISNVTGTWITADEATSPHYWARHLLEPVRFADGLATLRADGVSMAIECGPGQALSAMAGSAGELTVLPSLAHAIETPAGGSRLAEAVAGLWVAGVSIDWNALHPTPRRKVGLPLYAFDRQRFAPAIPVKAQTAPVAPPAPSVPLAKRADMGRWFYRPDWIPAAPAETVGLGGPWLILADTGGVAEALAGLLRDRGERVTLVARGKAYGLPGPDRFAINPTEAADHRRVLTALTGNGMPPCRLVHLWGLDEATPQEQEDNSLHALLALAQGLGSVMPGQPLRLDLVTRGAALVTGEETPCPTLAAAMGAAKVLPYEYPEMTVRGLDLPSLPGEATAALLADALALEGPEPEVAIRAGSRWAPTVVPLPLPAPLPTLGEGKVVVLTGGFGGVGTALARDLAREPRIGLVLLGRSPLPDRSAWDPLIAAGDEIAPRLTLVRALETAGARVMTAAPDLTDPAALDAMLDTAAATLGPVTGVIHIAGIADDGGVVQSRKRADTDKVLAPKLAGTRALEQALGSHLARTGGRLDFLVLCSTLGSFLPAAKFGQVAYAAANDGLDLSAAAIAARTGWPVTAINWDDWVDAGMTVEAHKHWGIPAPTAEDGMTGEEGATALRRILAVPVRPLRVAVSIRDLPAMIAEAATRFAPAAASPAVTGPERAAEPAPLSQSADEDAVVTALTAAFRDILEDPAAGPDDSFFERGGHSLLAMRLLAAIQERFGPRLGIAAVFDHPTPRALAAQVRARLTGPTAAAREKEPS